jgi:hypothetical protein
MAWCAVPVIRCAAFITSTTTTTAMASRVRGTRYSSIVDLIRAAGPAVHGVAQ